LGNRFICDRALFNLRLRWVMKMWAVRQEDPVTRFCDDIVVPFVFAQ
jgi:hypothetical protein